ncbi:hypothetical protein ACFL3C_02370 [Patescibacteria group bacterium]
MNKNLEKLVEATRRLPNPEGTVELLRNGVLEVDLEGISPLWEETRKRFIAAFGELQTGIMLHHVLPDQVLRR